MDPSILERFVADYERRRDDLLKIIEEKEAGRLRSGKTSETGRWIDTTSQTLEHDKEDLVELERLISDGKVQLNKQARRAP